MPNSTTMHLGILFCFMGIMSSCKTSSNSALKDATRDPSLGAKEQIYHEVIGGVDKITFKRCRSDGELKRGCILAPENESLNPKIPTISIDSATYIENGADIPSEILDRLVAGESVEFNSAREPEMWSKLMAPFRFRPTNYKCRWAGGTAPPSRKEAAIVDLYCGYFRQHGSGDNLCLNLEAHRGIENFCMSKGYTERDCANTFPMINFHYLDEGTCLMN